MFYPAGIAATFWIPSVAQASHLVVALTRLIRIAASSTRSPRHRQPAGRLDVTRMADMGPVTSMLIASLAAWVLAGCAASGPVPAAAEPRGEARPCPEGVAAASRCVAGRDSAGAYYWLVVPPAWNGTLVVHSHGGPELGAPRVMNAIIAAPRPRRAVAFNVERVVMQSPLDSVRDALRSTSPCRRAR